MKCILAAAIVALATHAAPARAADPSEIVAGKRAVQEAMNGGKVEALLAARARLAALSSAEPGSALLHYWAAFASWRDSRQHRAFLRRFVPAQRTVHTRTLRGRMVICATSGVARRPTTTTTSPYVGLLNSVSR